MVRGGVRQRLTKGTRRRIVAALKRHKGNLAAAAVELRLSPSTLWSQVDLLGLRDVAASLRPPRWWSEPGAREHVLAVMEKHQGRIDPIAKELGKSVAVIHGVIERLQLESELQAIRDRAIAERRAEIARLLAVHGGHTETVAREIGMSTYGLRKLLDRLGLKAISHRRRRRAPPRYVQRFPLPPRPAGDGSQPQDQPYIDPLDEGIAAVTVRTLLEIHHGVVAAVAVSLGITPYRVGLLLNRHELRDEAARLRGKDGRAGRGGLPRR